MFMIAYSVGKLCFERLILLRNVTGMNSAEQHQLCEQE